MESLMGHGVTMIEFFAQLCIAQRDDVQVQKGVSSCIIPQLPQRDHCYVFDKTVLKQMTRRTQWGTNCEAWGQGTHQLPTVTASEKPLGGSLMPIRNQAGSNLIVFESPKHALHFAWYDLFSVTLFIIASESLHAMKITAYLTLICLTDGMSGLSIKQSVCMRTPDDGELTYIRCSRIHSPSTKCIVYSRRRGRHGPANHPKYIVRQLPPV